LTLWTPQPNICPEGFTNTYGTCRVSTPDNKVQQAGQRARQQAGQVVGQQAGQQAGQPAGQVVGQQAGQLWAVGCRAVSRVGGQRAYVSWQPL